MASGGPVGGKAGKGSEWVCYHTASLRRKGVRVRKAGMIPNCGYWRKKRNGKGRAGRIVAFSKEPADTQIVNSSHLLIANFPPSFGGPSIHAGWMRAANPRLMEIITRGKREESRTKIRKDVSSYKELQRWKKKSEHGRAWVLVLTLILCHGKKSHTSPDGRRWEPTAKVPCHLPPGLEPETANLLVMFPRKSMNLLLTCVLSEWFIDFFSISKWLILLFFFKCQN